MPCYLYFIFHLNFLDENRELCLSIFFEETKFINSFYVFTAFPFEDLNLSVIITQDE